LYCLGVTGTNGKSSSVYLIKVILQAADIKAGLLNSLVYNIGSVQFKADRTTPESPVVQRYLRGMLQSGCTHAIIEVSSHALVLARVENIDFKIGLFTNFSRDHLDFHETMEKYLEAKKLLLHKLTETDKTAVLNLDVPEFAELVPDVKNSKGRVVTYSTVDNTADISAGKIELYHDHSKFELKLGSESRHIKFHLPGRYNISNACGAAAAAYAAGILPDQIAAGLELAKPVPGRFVPVSYGQPFGIFIDYAHTPDAIVRLCQSARELTKGRLLILFGCGGDRDKGKRPLMGKAATEYSDFAILTSDNPRTEDPQAILDDVIPGIENSNYEVFIDRVEAIQTIVNRAAQDDTLLIAGKGAEDYQEIGTTRHPFSDTDEIIKALENRGFRG